MKNKLTAYNKKWSYDSITTGGSTNPYEYEWSYADIDNYTISDRTVTTSSTAPVLEIYGRDILKELDEIRDAVLLLTKDAELEKKYPELKQAYDDYMELYRGIQIADKISNYNNDD